MKTHPFRRHGFASLGVIVTMAIIVLGGGLLAWEWRGAHPSGKSHAAKAAKESGHHHKEGKKHHADS